MSKNMHCSYARHRINIPVVKPDIFTLVTTLNDQREKNIPSCFVSIAGRYHFLWYFYNWNCLYAIESCSSWFIFMKTHDTKIWTFESSMLKKKIELGLRQFIIPFNTDALSWFQWCYKTRQPRFISVDYK